MDGRSEGDDSSIHRALLLGDDVTREIRLLKQMKAGWQEIVIEMDARLIYWAKRVT
jgi:hypothetical protein